MASFIKFLGTAGARFVTMRQLRSGAGVLYSLRGFHFPLDPGPGTLVRCASSRPRMAILTHFGISMLRAKPWEVARQLAEETGVEVHAASDGATSQI
jgi:hypothetical protein